jgi:hypothetical protein
LRTYFGERHAGQYSTIHSRTENLHINRDRCKLNETSSVIAGFNHQQHGDPTNLLANVMDRWDLIVALALSIDIWEDKSQSGHQSPRCSLALARSFSRARSLFGRPEAPGEFGFSLACCYQQELQLQPPSGCLKAFGRFRCSINGRALRPPLRKRTTERLVWLSMLQERPSTNRFRLESS